MKHTEAAYLAGFFDGEGSIYICRGRPTKAGRQYFLCVSIVNTKHAIIQEFQKLFAGGLTINPDTRKRRSLLRHRVYSRQAVDLLVVLLPFLRLKKRQAELAIAFQSEISVWLKKGRTLMSENRKQWYIEQINNLNQKGPFAATKCA